MDSPILIHAVLVWAGFGLGIAPNRDGSRLMQQFGATNAERLLPIIKKLEEDFYSSDARFMASNIDEMGKLATEHFKRIHPEVANEIARVFAWCYTFDFK